MPTTLHALKTYRRSKEIWSEYPGGGWSTNRPVSPKLADSERGEVNVTALTDYFARLLVKGNSGDIKKGLTILEESHLIEVRSVFDEIERRWDLGFDKSGFSSDVQNNLGMSLASVREWYAAGMPLE
ncbi:hypothetical protein A2363_04130 [Candidatus Gottesmanbacteria bacterium RIFOXYB1_FULL_47_11]|uniref:Uncharacterized protein n=1 Tax=Candidatus Gottesmanbacteria bacterium RIFOXYB1_FULL_47_11 TaxID=1798401 RepID=A0A1F6BCN7_9BACT|nr:MAG: hypothetical protein A2363_04130 [Candidatus Gottesmanbacteria bacterium RIFOXYB1_FULL_47_11]